MSDRPTDDRIVLDSIRWERVQVIVEARADPAAVFDPRSFELRRASGGSRFPPTHASTENGRILLRYNVMNGPGLDPIEAGRWTLGLAVSGAAAGAIDPVTSAGEFQLVDRLLTVTPVLDPDAGTLSFDAAFDTTVRRAPDPTVEDRARLAARQAVIQARRGGFPPPLLAARPSPPRPPTPGPLPS